MLMGDLADTFTFIAQYLSFFILQLCDVTNRRKKMEFTFRL